MKIFIGILALSLSLSSCERHLSRNETETALKDAFYRFLITQPNYDSTKVRFDVKSVNFFEDKTFFECEFNVHMKMTSGVDTSGFMTARISKDFSSVKRKL
jgi:hypothetical protein